MSQNLQKQLQGVHNTQNTVNKLTVYWFLKNYTAFILHISKNLLLFVYRLGY